MNDSEALRSKLEGVPDWRYVETRTRHALEQAMRSWARLREARELMDLPQDHDGR